LRLFCFPLQAFVAAPATRRSDKRRLLAIASAATIALAITALVFVATGPVCLPFPLHPLLFFAGAILGVERWVEE